MDEKKFLDSLVPEYITSDTSSQIRLMRDLSIRIFKPYIQREGIALELGSEIGYMSEKIAELICGIDIVDGSEEFLDKVKQRNIMNAEYFCSLFEEYDPGVKYDYVFMSHVLEHLVDVRVILSKVKNEFLHMGGYLFITVPNARALSRQLARHMGFIDNLYDLTENDIRGGHRRVYDRITLNRDIENAGFEIVAQGGILFKPFADFQMEQLIDDKFLKEEHLEGLYKLGNEYPDMCADLYAICRIKN